MSVIVVGQTGVKLTVRVKRLPIAGEIGLLHERLDLNRAAVGGTAIDIGYRLHRFGVPTHLYGAIGKDRYGKRCMQFLQESGMGIEMVSYKSRQATPMQIRVIDDRKSHQIYHYPGLPKGQIEDPERFDTLSKGARYGVVAFDGLPPRCDVLDRLCSHNLKIVWIAHNSARNWPADVVLKFIRASDYVILNRWEETGIKELLGLSNANELLNEGPQVIVSTSAKQGTMIIEHGGVEHIPAIIPIDNDDAFAAGFVFGLVNNLTALQSGRCGTLLVAFAEEQSEGDVGLPSVEAFLRRYRDEFHAPLDL